MDNIDNTALKLCAASVRHFDNPWSLEWPDTIEMNSWFMSPEFISLYGSCWYEELNNAQRQRLSFFECINFFSLNINGERRLIEGAARRLGGRQSRAVTQYLHHFIDEENKHMVYFENFCLRYAGKVYSDRKLMLPREYAPGEEDFLFFVKVLIFEELVDQYNRRMALDESLHPLVRKINLMHHKDEARHIVFGRELIAALFKTYAQRWNRATRAAIQTYIQKYLSSVEKEYFNPEALADARLADPRKLSGEAQKLNAAHAARRQFINNITGQLHSLGILEEAA